MPIVHMSDMLSVVYSPSHLVKLLSYLGAFHLFTYASIGGGGFNTDAYKCPQGGRGGLNMTKNTILYACLLKMLHYLKHLRIDHTSVEFTLLNAYFISSKNKSDKNDFKFIFP